jgi:hypothetical protein
MSRYVIKYQCGHEGREQFYGSTKDRQRRADWKALNFVCPSCFIKQKAQENRNKKNEIKEKDQKEYEDIIQKITDPDIKKYIDKLRKKIVGEI